jgi:hypothetical protein
MEGYGRMTMEGNAAVHDNSREQVYLGEWRKGLMHGEGSYEWSDGRLYKGHYRENVKHG